ncbi:hypothetical protein BGZ76_007549 [Entomortierella beljakovae]|nr:hypothetical protein BGZ76_007549 [Entomortierella beljakovae]
MSNFTSNAKQGIFTLCALLEQVQDPNADAHQILQHLQNNFDSMNEVSQQFTAMQNTLHNAMPPQAQIDLTSAIQTLIHQNQEYAQVQQHASHVLERLAQRSSSVQSHVQIPMPLSTKYKGDNDELTFPEFNAKLQTMFARFPDALKTDHDQI